MYIPLYIFFYKTFFFFTLILFCTSYLVAKPTLVQFACFTLRYSISQRTKILWFYAETKSIKRFQQKFKEHFNVARAPRKPNILSLVDKFSTNGSEMLDIMILTFPKE